MQAKCPHCDTLFNITQRHLNMADGRVRCSQCRGVFDGYSALISDEPETETPKAQTKDYGVKIDLDKKDKGNRVDIVPDNNTKPKNLIYGDLLEDDYDSPRRFERLRRLFMGVIGTIAFLGLLAQLAYLKRDLLADQPLTKKWVVLACDKIPNCTIPKKRAIGKIKLDSRHIYGHPNINGALVVSASFSNRATFSQPYPTLVISMSNIRGQEVAARRFSPKEYLDGNQNIERGFGSGDNVTINLQIADPGNEAMAFEIDFL